MAARRAEDSKVGVLGEGRRVGKSEKRRGAAADSLVVFLLRGLGVVSPGGERRCLLDDMVRGGE